MSTDRQYAGLRIAPTAGLYFAPVGFLMSLIVVALAEWKASYFPLLIWGPLGAFVSGYVVWRFVVVRRATYSKTAGRWAGAMSAASMHLFASVGMFLHNKLCYLTTGGCMDSFGQPPMPLVDGLAISLGYALLSIVFVFGWISVPIGIVLGQRLVAKQRHSAEQG